ncbi:MAG: hypothetical protein JW703_04875 [Candidatus Diapherotrites archaeon]|nr:hypothetical protein [Candidatus Diapherotrites archaeon]
MINMNLSFDADKKYIKLIDSVINESKMYSSRSEFLKSAVREKVEKQQDLNWRIKFKQDVKKMAETAVKRGWNGELLTREEKAKIADEFLKKKGFNPDLLAP